MVLVLGLGGGASLRGDGQNAGNVAPHDPHTRGVLKLSARLLKSQVELLLLKLERFVVELIIGHNANVGETAGRFHSSAPYSAMRCTKRVLIGSLAAARLNASR